MQIICDVDKLIKAQFLEDRVKELEEALSNILGDPDAGALGEKNFKDASKILRNKLYV